MLIDDMEHAGTALRLLPIKNPLKKSGFFIKNGGRDRI
jgi:hypothetical protein